MVDTRVNDMAADSCPGGVESMVDAPLHVRPTRGESVGPWVLYTCMYSSSAGKEITNEVC